MNCFWGAQEWVVGKVVPDIVDKRPLKKYRKEIMRAIFLFSCGFFVCFFVVFFGREVAIEKDLEA